MNAAIEGDLLGSPIPKDGPSWSWTGLLGKATREPGEPEHVLENLTGHSVWFRWTAPSSGPFGLVAGRPDADWFSAGVTLDRLRPAIPHLGASVYRDANNPGELKLVAGPDRSWTGTGVTRFEAVSGETYCIAFEGNYLSPTQPATVELVPLPSTPPPNDQAQSATPWPPEAAFQWVSLAGATRESDEPGWGSWNEPVLSFQPFTQWFYFPADRGGNSAWFRWVAPASGRFGLEALFPASFPQLAVFRIPDPAPLPLSWNSLVRVDAVTNVIRDSDTTWNASPQLRSVISAEVGDTFLFQVDQLIPSIAAEEGSYPLRQTITNALGRLSLKPLPGSFDDFSNAVGMGTHDEVFRDAPFASLEPGEPPMPGGATGSLWWRWTAPADTMAGVSGAVDAFSGTRVDALTPVPLPAPAGQHLSRFPVRAGVTYHFRTAPDPGGRTGFGITILCRNDRIENAAEYPPGSTTLTLPPGIASQDPGEPETTFGMEIGISWVRWTPPSPGRFALTCRNGGGRIATVVRRLPGDVQEVVPFMTEVPTTYVDVDVAEPLYIGIETPDRVLHTGGQLQVEALPSQDSTDQPRTLAWPSGTAGDSIPYRITGTAESGEAAHAGRPAHASLWYDATVPSDGRWELWFAGYGRPRLVLYRNNPPGTLIPVISLSPAESLGIASITASLDAQAGDRFRIAIEPGSFSGLTWDVPEIQLQILPALTHDTVATALALTNRLTGQTTLGGSLDGDEPDPGPGGPWSSVWYHTAASSDGRSAILVSGGESGKPWGPLLRVYRKEDSGRLSLLGRNVRGLNPQTAVATATSLPQDPLWIQVLSERDHPEFFTIESARRSSLPNAPAVQLRPVGPGRQVDLVGDGSGLMQIEVSNDLEHWTPFGDTLAGRVSTWTGYRPAAIQAPETETDGTIFIRRRP